MTSTHHRTRPAHSPDADGERPGAPAEQAPDTASNGEQPEPWADRAPNTASNSEQPEPWVDRAPNTASNSEQPEAPAEQAPVGGLGAGAVAGGVGIGDVVARVCSARDLVAAVSQAPLEGAGEEALREVVAAGGRLRSAVEALLLGATAALEAVRAGAGRAALRDEARLGARAAARKAAVGGRLAQMPNVADALARGELTAEHAEVLADTARRTSPDAVNDAQALHQSAAQVSPEVLRREAEAFAVRWDPAGAQGELGRQRRDRGAALFRDDESGMGVLNARFDPISFALVRQAVETYNDALWRLDAGRDGTPAQVRDNRQRLADSVFEMLTGRNALHTQQHPTQPTADSPTGPTPAPTPSTPSRTGSEMLAHSGAIATHRTAARQATAGDGPTGTAPHAGPPPAGANAPLADDDALPVGAHTLPARTNAPPAGAIGSSDADSGECTCGAAEGSDLPGRSVSRFAPSHAPNQLVIVADIGVIDGTDPHGRCDVLGAGPVPASILDTISPDTRITAALFGGPGQLLWLGRSRRHASSAQQLAVAIRDRGCVLCGAPMHRCDLHHIDEWTADNGPTDLPNLAALCGDCHNNLHKSKRKLHHENRTGPPTETASAAPTKPTGRDSPDGLGDSSGRDSPGGPDGPTSQHGPS